MKTHKDSSKITMDEFDRIYDKYYPQLLYYAYGFVEDSEICRDIVSDVFGQAWENVERLGNATVGSFLYSCVRNKCIDYLRHDQAARQYAEYLQEAVEDEEGMTPEEYEERMNNVKQIILELPPRTRFVLEQCYFNNKKYREVAEILDITSSAVKKHIMKALAILRERLSVIKP
ncbi:MULTISPECIES: RNA polymerase sigma-70 factor [Bacteroides]|jgi:RNA polymerase sigma-70 factor (ECF subfamily)|uniref:RNA polymerase sigma-70 factor n=1 Tax=Bacteroides TaxID=816 RepID=UPI00138ECFA5|nr:MULTISPECIES: RNA polymerase sigma-70 factor [Bacteroides]NDO54037.1 RNA polymerase sigma-70 factor [Bacteroides acidifaciens]NDO58765.1 RNA polymerase sigma-70 factor [Bacteroides caecimuris]